MTAYKNNKKDCKPPLKYVLPETIEGCAYGMLAGGMKYLSWNHLRGHNLTDLLDAAQRHLNAVRMGEDIDQDTTKRLKEGCIDINGNEKPGYGDKAPDIKHLWLVISNINMILHQEYLGTLIDDRKEYLKKS